MSESCEKKYFKLYSADCHVAIMVQDAESYFDIDEFNDLYAKTKPTLYIKMSDIFSIHKLVSAEISHICIGHDDILREVVRDLGSVQSNETELMGVSAGEISLTLTPKLHNVEGTYIISNLGLRIMLTCVQILKQRPSLSLWRQSDASFI